MNRYFTFHKLILSIVLLIVSFSDTYAQISGTSNNVCVNSTKTYSTSAIGTYSWSVIGGSITGSNTGANVSVKWGTGTNGTVTLVVFAEGPLQRTAQELEEPIKSKKPGKKLRSEKNVSIENYGKVVGPINKTTYFYSVTISSLNPGSIGGAKTICYNASAGTLTNSSSGSGGNYQWQVSSNGTSGWSNISGKTSSTYGPGNLTATRWYRRRINSSVCGNKYTNKVKVTVRANLSAGNINGAKTICYNASAGTLGNASSASGGTGSYTYQWQKSSTGTSGWSNISGATATTYAPGNLTATKYYRRRVISSGGCGTKYTGNVKVTVRANLSGGSINGAKTICYNTSAGTLGSTANASGGTGSYTYQWQISTTGTSGWSNISGATATTYAPGNLTATKYYRRRVISSGGCGTKYTGNVKVTVYSNLAAGSINGANTICYNTSAGILGNAGNATGGTGSFAYQWQVSSTGTSGWSNVSGATSTTYSPGNLTASKYYRRAVTSGSCGTKYTSNVAVTVYPNTVVDAGSNITLLNTDSPITLSGTPAGGTWSGTGVSGNSFDPSQVALGNHTLAYSFTDGNGCSGTDQRTITVVIDEGDVPDATEIAALKDLYESTNGASWTNSTSWPTSAAEWSAITYVVQVSGWNGVSTLNGDITELNLDSNNLIGTMPATLGDLTSVQKLLLSSNQLTGPIPVELGNITNLTNLELDQNQLTGPIPSELGDLSQLEYLRLSTNNLSGTIPASLGGLINLLELKIDNNDLTGSIPSELGSLTKAHSLFLHRNELTGVIPVSFGGLAKMKYLYLFENQLSGTIPAELGGLSTMVNLWLSSNNFTDDIPVEIAGLNALKVLNLDNNNLTSFPDFTANSNAAVLKINISSNAISIADIDQNLSGADQSVYSSFVYSPQVLATPSTQTLDVVSGDVVLTNDLPVGTHGQYQWQQYNGTTWDNVTGETSSTLTITYNWNMEGDQYRCSVSNSWVSGISGYSSTFVLKDVDVDDTPTTDPNPGAGEETVEATALYDGTISAMAWRTDEAFATETGETKGMYLFEYDNKYQLKGAVFADPTFNSNGNHTFEMSSNIYRVSNLNYDHNGNITRLRRYGENALKLHDFKYNYSGIDNQLESIDGYAEYTYNALGQMVRQAPEDPEDSKFVEYDVTGKVVAVYSNGVYDEPNDKVTSYDLSSIKVKYQYDDRGFRLAKILYEYDEATEKAIEGKSTWYIRDASGNVMSIYEQEDELVEFEKSNFSSGEDGWTASGGFAFTGNQDGVLGVNNTMKLELISAGNNQHYGTKHSVVAEPGVTYTISVDFYVPDSNIELLGFQLTNSAGGQILIDATNIIKGSWQTFTTTAEYSTGNRFVLRGHNGSSIIFANSTAEFAYMKNYRIEKMEEQFTQVEIPVYGSGKIGVYYPQKSTGKMAYELTDHLGNVRAVVKDDVETVYLATMESGNTPSENTLFEEVAFDDFGNTRIPTVTEINHTPIELTGSSPEVVRLNGVRGVRTGPSIDLKVQAGDRIDAEVFVKYLDLRDDSGIGAAGIISALFSGASGFTLNVGDGSVASVITDTNTGVSAMLGGSGAATAPDAHLNILFIPDSGGANNYSFDEMDETAAIDPVNLNTEHQLLSRSIEITESGTIQVYLDALNTDDVDIYFDDLKVTHYRSKVVTQTTDYYPGGMAMRESKTNEDTWYRYGYQGEFAERDEESGNYHFELRDYDPAINRWLVPDPMRQHFSPYLSMSNNWVNSVDPNGGEDWIPKVDKYGNTYYVAEAGDNLQTFMNQFNVSQDDAMKYLGLSNIAEGIFNKNHTFNAGEKVYAPFFQYNLGKTEAGWFSPNYWSKATQQKTIDHFIFARDYALANGLNSFKVGDIYNWSKFEFSGQTGFIFRGKVNMDGIIVPVTFDMVIIYNSIIDVSPHPKPVHEDRFINYQFFHPNGTFKGYLQVPNKHYDTANDYFD